MVTNMTDIALFIFVYNDDSYVPIKIKHLNGHLHMYRIKNSIDPGCLKITKFFLWDALTIEWNELKLYVSNELVKLNCQRVWQFL